MPDTQSNPNPLGFLSRIPAATLLAVLLTLALGIVSLIDTSKLDFDSYTSQIVVIWSFLALGRGIAANNVNSASLPDQNPVIRFLNAFPWATVVAGIVAVIGYVGVILGDTDMSWTSLGTKLAVLAGALGVGRGLGNVSFGASGVAVQLPEPGTDGAPATVEPGYPTPDGDSEPVADSSDASGEQDDPNAGQPPVKAAPASLTQSPGGE